VADFLPYGRQTIDEADIAAVAEVLRGDWLTTGPAVDAFEAAFAKTVGAGFAVACSSGTAALHLAALALGLGRGDTAIVPAMTFVATANAARYVGAEVAFADVDPATGLMGPAELETALRRVPRGARAKAVFPVHLNGQCADPAGLKAIADANGLRIAEDACHALGATYDDGVPVGAARNADLAIFSFHPVKTVTMGEGGAVTGNDVALERRLRLLRNHGLTRDPDAFVQMRLAHDAGGAPNPWYYEMPEPGFNYRASDIACALGTSQLAKLSRFVARRRALAARYDGRLSSLAPLVRPIGRAPGCEPAWHLYVVLVDFAAAGRDRAAVMGALHRQGIGTQVHYLPVAWQPYYRARYGEADLPGAAAYYARCLSLPLYPAMTDGDVDRVVDALATAIGAA
jgi:UDP-4-amino-4,6-dideoxy-N-acetyl-beta-L-altrosamine transaminase